MTIRNLVSALWLHEQLNDEQLVIADCRFTLGNPGAGLAQYLENHIPGALYFDLEQDLSSPIGEHGGRHPLPSVETLTELFSQAGIDHKTTVVAYDGEDMSKAARLWWLLRYLGHEKVYILDGGLTAWQRAGFEVTNEVTPLPEPRVFTAHLQPDMVVDVEVVKTRSNATALLDSRGPERYRGEVEPIDPKAGHIPGAVNYPYQANLTAEGTLLSKGELAQRFAPLADKQELIVYCGSGVTACVNVLALLEAGRTDVKLYAGSWSDWISYQDNPVSTGQE